MSDSANPEVSPEQRPDAAALGFSLDPVLESVVGLRSHVPDDAVTAPVLGTERAGHGIVVEELTRLVVDQGLWFAWFGNNPNTDWWPRQ